MDNSTSVRACDASSRELSSTADVPSRPSLDHSNLGITYNSMDFLIIKLPFGFSETSKGCCGTGTIEYAGSCKGLSTCADRTKYLFWDAAHFTEKMYKIIADEALTSVIESLLN
ncbi:unnamed protein product [Ilex paraguariensis]|uniref:GDSL esterase/lipase n=1 Tax=Ilex paraguariensis TaxID=185542 RepID=A0ABC8QTF8_9AQUA